MSQITIEGAQYYVDVVGVQIINVATLEATNFNKLEQALRNIIVAGFY